MDLTDNGRWVVGALALIVAGFALGNMSRLQLAPELAASMLGGAAVLLLIASRRGRNGGV